MPTALAMGLECGGAAGVMGGQRRDFTPWGGGRSKETQSIGGAEHFGPWVLWDSIYSLLGTSDPGGGSRKMLNLP